MNLQHTALHGSPQPSDSRALVQARLQSPWQQGLQQLHGLHGLVLATPAGCPSLAGSGIRCWHVLSDGFPAVTAGDLPPSCVASLARWPLQPASLDAVVWQLEASPGVPLTELLAQASLSLGPDARLLVSVHGERLNSWCRVAMPWLAANGFQLRQATWGDSRRLTWLPPSWGRHWSASWQRLLPVTAHWTVQLWQKDTLAPVRPRRAHRAPTGWAPHWQPLASTPTTPRKDMA